MNRLFTSDSEINPDIIKEFKSTMGQLIVEDKMSHVIDNIFIGNVDHAQNRSLLQFHKIEVIVNLSDYVYDTTTIMLRIKIKCPISCNTWIESQNHSRKG